MMAAIQKSVRAYCRIKMASMSWVHLELLMGMRAVRIGLPDKPTRAKRVVNQNAQFWFIGLLRDEWGWMLIIRETKE
jgi:hypothetical protein